MENLWHNRRKKIDFITPLATNKWFRFIDFYLRPSWCHIVVCRIELLYIEWHKCSSWKQRQTGMQFAAWFTISIYDFKGIRSIQMHYHLLCLPDVSCDRFWSFHLIFLYLIAPHQAWCPISQHDTDTFIYFPLLTAN